MMSKTYQVRPSEIIGVSDDEYVAYCFDEACAYFLSELAEKKTPHFQDDEKSNPTLTKLVAGLL